jgi:AraC-like DNA-binding protein
MNSKKLLLLFSIFITINMLSQNIDYDNLKKDLEYYKNINNDSVLSISKKLQSSQNERSVLEATSAEAYAYYRKKNYDKSKKVALNLLDRVNERLSHPNIKEYHYDIKISVLNRLFWINKNQERFNKAYECLVLMQETNKSNPSKKLKYFRHKVSIKISKGIIKKSLKMEYEAKNILLSAYNDIESDVFKEIANDNYFLQQKANTLNSLGNIYMTLYRKDSISKHIDSAAFYFDKSFLVTKSFIPLHKDSEIFYSFRKTEVLIAKEEYRNAVNEINKYAKISNGYHYKHREYFQKAICYHNLKVADSTIYYAFKIINDKKEKCRPSKLITMYDILSKEYNRLQRVDSAYKYSQLTLEQYALARADKEKTFNSLYKNDYNQSQRLNVKIKEDESLKQQKIVVGFVSLLSVSSIMIFLFFRKEKNKKEELLAEIDNQKPIEVEKKEYNIDKALEDKILAEIEKVNGNLDFLKFDFSISSIAESLKTNSTYVSFVFNKHYNESFKQHFAKRKIEYIVDLLKNNKTYRKYSIQALAEETGYTNASAFTRVFKKQMGVTPSIFLKTLDE